MHLRFILPSAIFLYLFIGSDACSSRLTEHLRRIMNNSSAYNKNLRPVNESKKVVTVYLGLELSQIITVDDRNEMVTTRLWLQHEWVDDFLVWNPDEFDGHESCYVPSEQIWRPDIELENCADGKSEFKAMTRATVWYDGTVQWSAPGVFRSVCRINVEFFPYDQQLCTMKFGSSTYDASQLNIRHYLQQKTPHLEGDVAIDYAIDLLDFQPSVEFELKEASAIRRDVVHTRSRKVYPEIMFTLRLKRRTLFFTLNLMMPCVAISFLTVLIFYLPSDSREKISLSISILVSLTLFFLLMAETIPQTSLVVPLIGKYLLFTIILVMLSIIFTVIVLNTHFRSSETHQMSPCTRRIFLEILPPFLGMRSAIAGESEVRENPTGQNCNSSPASQSGSTIVANNMLEEKLDGVIYYDDGVSTACTENTKDSLALPRLTRSMKKKAKSAVEGLSYVERYLRVEDFQASIQGDWKYMAMVLDRLFLYLFAIACILSSMSIILRAPVLYDWNQELTPSHYPEVIHVNYLNQSQVIRFAVKSPVPAQKVNMSI